jgi:DNA-binding XRE family transcriptional regulator
MILANLKTKRDNMMMTQAELSHQSGVTIQTISRLEGKGSASVTTAKKLSKAMRCRVEDLTETRKG